MVRRNGTQTAFVIAFGALAAALVLSVGVLGGGPSEAVVLAEASDALESEAASVESDVSVDDGVSYVSATPLVGLDTEQVVDGAPTFVGFGQITNEAERPIGVRCFYKTWWDWIRDKITCATWV